MQAADLHEFEEIVGRIAWTTWVKPGVATMRLNFSTGNKGQGAP